jgi:hypothetical protein
MKNLKTFLLAISAIAIFAGCKNVKIQNGEVPSQYLSQAKKLEGTYHGSFNGIRGDLVIHFEGNRPVVTYKGANGNDILNGGCGSDIGLLTKVTIKSENKNPRVSDATFEFNPGSCSLQVEGRTLDIGFKEKDGVLRLSASILQETRPVNVCQWDPGAPPRVPPYQNCHTEFQSTYLMGSFVR